MEPTRFDLTARRVARLDPAGFFCWLLTRFPETMRWAGWLDPRSAPPESDAEVTGDLIARLNALHQVGPPWMFPVEFQTTPDPKMFGRLQTQIGQWWTDLQPDDLPDSRYPVGAAVVNLTGTSASAPASRLYRFPTPDKLLWGGKVKERYLAEESADETLGRMERDELSPCPLPFVVLMKGGGESGIMSRWIAVAKRVLNTRLRADLGSMALTLAALKEWYEEWKVALKEWNMQESQYVLELQQATAVNTKIDALRRVLEARIGVLPPDLLRQIEAIKDLNRLDQLFATAARANTWEDFSV
jgi:hypothetical protein